MAAKKKESHKIMMSDIEKILKSNYIMLTGDELMMVCLLVWLTQYNNHVQVLLLQYDARSFKECVNNYLC